MTGGTGFVGSHVVFSLVEKGATVVVLYRSIDPRSYFALSGVAAKTILAIGDVKDRERLVDVVTKYEIEDIIHLAAQPIVTTAYHNPVETITTNVLGTTHVLDAAWVSGTVQRIIVTSSDKAYGKSSKAYTEDQALRGDHPYEASKAAGDVIAQAYAKTYNAPVVTVRFGNIYGPGDLNFSRIIPSIVKTALTGEPIRLRSDGTFVRDYVYVGDVVAAYLFLLSKMPSICGEVFNISCDTTLSVVDLMKTSKKILGTPIPFVVENSQKNEIPYQHLDYGKVTKLGWKPRWTFEQGLKETYQWYKKNARAIGL